MLGCLMGSKKMRRKVTQIDRRTNKVVSVSYQTKELVHCNFGWGKDKGNGYYLSKVFNTLKGPVMKGEVTYRVTSGQEYNYQYNHQIIKNIKVK